MFVLSMELLRTINLLALALVLLIAPKIYEAFRILVWRPLMISRRFKKQGISGPKYRILHGNFPEMRQMKKEAKLSVLDPNSNDIVPRVLPHIQLWMSQYGETFLYWQGTEPRLCISDHELAKQILSNKFGFFVKPKIRPDIIKLTGTGLVLVDGLNWVRHRRILNPAFSIDKIKIMTQFMVECTLKMLEEWRKQRSGVETEQMVMINREFQRLTADIIATAAFGSSYAEGIEFFKSQRELQKCCATSITNVFIPGTQYLPTPLNLQKWKLDRKMNNSIKRIIDARLKSKAKNSESDYGNDLLGIMLTAARSNESETKMTIDEIIEECKTFFFAGHETTANTLTWTTMLLSLHQDWQEKLREEVFNECGKDKIPDPETCSKLKLMNMVLMESLRLYGPVINMVRSVSEDMKLGNLDIPKGTTVVLPIVKMHRDKTVWGSDSDKFNPMRFENGVSRAANHPNALLAFSMGPRACIGQNFAMMEAKTVLAMILQRFRLNLSDDYKHAPADHITLQPQYDLPLMLQPIDG
ncbi:Cytochrome [Cardamine amara subsp. amara]|uniref:Cytochrome n=1 Tax=Cardamine amara subsp. amara TaxID=228776 RepID=A0ABD0ZDJ1_CARAN